MALRKQSFSRPQLAVFVLAFALIGFIIVRTFAANPNLPGDINNDNTVNITDLSILLTNYGTTNTTADLNADNTVNITDLSILLSHFGQSYTGAGNWTFCANEDEYCSFTGTMEVRYGANTTYVSKTLSNGTQCDNTVFGDPLQGITKHCEYRPSTGTPPPPIGTPIPTSIASDCSVDVSTQILNWINSVPNNTTLLFGANKCYRIENSIDFSNRLSLVLDGNGSTFKSLNPVDDQRVFWRVWNSAGFVFKNMTIIGSYTNGGKHDTALQHAHAFDLRGTSAEVFNTNSSKLGGDCVYFGMGQTRSSGSYHDSTCTSIGRNAASVVAGDDIKIQRVTTSAIGFIPFDIEPNEIAGFGSCRVVVDSNTIGSYYLYAYLIYANEPICDQTFSNNRITYTGANGIGTKGNLRISNIKITGNTWTVTAPSSEGGAIVINSSDGITITGNTIPVSATPMAVLYNSCSYSVSGNSFPGGTSEYQIQSPPSNCSSPPPPTASPQCNDALDNDHDGKVDYPADTGCTSFTDNSE